MKKAFVAVVAGAEVHDTKNVDLNDLTNAITSHTLVLETPLVRGAAVIVAGKVITSLHLVANHRMVRLSSNRTGTFQAVVSRTDRDNFIAELEPVMVEREIAVKSGRHCFEIAPLGGVGEPLLAQDAKFENPTVVVLSMSYVISACERRRRDIWKTQQRLPEGLVGGGLWDINGKFSGLSLALKKPYHRFEDEMILALPGDDVMEFAEKTN